MSTNFYLRTPQHEAMYGPDWAGGLHLGLSAAGIFMFRAYPRLGIISLRSLKQHLRGVTGTIVNEYGVPLTLEEFLDFVSVRRKPDTPRFLNSPVVTDLKSVKDGMRFQDSEGYLFNNYPFC